MLLLEHLLNIPLQIRCSLVPVFPCVVNCVRLTWEFQQPQLLVFPVTRFPPSTSTLFPQLHLHSYLPPRPPILLTTNRRPNVFPEWSVYAPMQRA